MRDRRITRAIRRAWPAALVLALVLAVTAFAAVTHKVFYTGPVGDGTNNAGVEMKIGYSAHNRPVKVERFAWFNVPVPPNCAASDDFPTTIPINDKGGFHASADIPGTSHHAVVRGHLKPSHNKVVGTLRLTGNFSGGCNADTGPLSWVATRPAN